MSLEIGVVPDGHPFTADFKAFLEPARVRGCLDTLIGPHDVLWGVCRTGEPVAAATTRLKVDGLAEVVLVGGRDHRSWLNQLDEVIGASARSAGATALRAYGRRGWRGALCANGWVVLGEEGDTLLFERGL